MLEITILSGKGGTGKTTIAASLASVAENAVFCDNDVDAADLHLIFQPQVVEEHPFASGWKAHINSLECTNCGTCTDYCHFGAIHFNQQGNLEINPFQCEGCRLCERTCPSHAISSQMSNNSAWYISDSRLGPLVHAQMGPGEENSGKLVTLVRKKAAQIATEQHKTYIINDGPPGIGCATISSLSGTGAVLLVIEPTRSGMHDASRLVELIRIFDIQAYALINKYDLNRSVSHQIECYLTAQNIPLLAKIPFDSEMVQAMNHGLTIGEYNPSSPIAKQIRMIWDQLKDVAHK